MDLVERPATTHEAIKQLLTEILLQHGLKRRSIFFMTTENS